MDSAVVEGRKGKEDVRGWAVARVKEMDSTNSDGDFGLGERLRGPPFEWRTQKGGGHGCA